MTWRVSHANFDLVDGISDRFYFSLTLDSGHDAIIIKPNYANVLMYIYLKNSPFMFKNVFKIE